MRINGTKVKILAYADDICVIGRNKEEIERMLERIYKYTQWAGLKFNPAKCWSLSMINHGVRKYNIIIMWTTFKPGLGARLPAITEMGGEYKYLGVQRDRTMERSPKELVDTITEKAEKICNLAQR